MAYPPIIPPTTRANATPQLDSHPADHNAVAQALTDIVAKLDVTAWVALTLNSGWAAYGNGYAGPQYRRCLGRLEIMGTVSNGSSPAAGSVIAVIPAGFRPAANHYHGTLGSGGLVRVDYQTASNGLVWQGAQGGAATAGLIDLDLSFPL